MHKINKVAYKHDTTDAHHHEAPAQNRHCWQRMNWKYNVCIVICAATDRSNKATRNLIEIL